MDDPRVQLITLLEECYHKAVNVYPAHSVEGNAYSLVFVELIPFQKPPQAFPVSAIMNQVIWLIDVSLSPRQYELVARSTSPERAKAARAIHLIIVERLIIYLETCGLDSQLYRDQLYTFEHRPLEEYIPLARIRPHTQPPCYPVISHLRRP